MKLCCFGLLIPAAVAIICASAVPVGARAGKKGSSGNSKKSGKKTSAPTSGGSVPDPQARCVRERCNLREHTSHADVFGKLNDLGGDPHGAPFEREGILSLKHCEKLKSFADESRDEDLRGGVAQQDGDVELNDYSKEISPSYLVEMFSLHTMKGILEFFYESVGSKVPIIRSQVRRSFMEGPQDMHVPYHTDANRSTVLILSLNGDEDYEGGELLYLNHQGPPSRCSHSRKGYCPYCQRCPWCCPPQWHSLHTISLGHDGRGVYPRGNLLARGTQIL
jgi:hypothetical protein